MGWFRRAWRTFSGWPRWAQVLTGIVIVVVIGAAASGGNKSPSATTTSSRALGSTSPNATVTNTPGGQGSSSSGPSHRITKVEYGSRWPLTVSEGTLSCQPPGALTFTTDDETVYWINGTAGDAASKNGWMDVKPIWAKPKHPEFAGERKNIGVLIDDGLKLCGS